MKRWRVGVSWGWIDKGAKIFNFRSRTQKNHVKNRKKN